MYKKAIKVKLRFNTSRGSLSTEVFNTLPMSEIAEFIKTAKKELNKDSDDDLSFLDNSVVVDELAELRFNIAKDIYLTKKSESEAISSAQKTKAHNQKILGLIQEKKEAALSSMSVEDLEKMLK